MKKTWNRHEKAVEPCLKRVLSLTVVCPNRWFLARKSSQQILIREFWRECHVSPCVSGWRNKLIRVHVCFYSETVQKTRIDPLLAIGMNLFFDASFLPIVAFAPTNHQYQLSYRTWVRSTLNLKKKPIFDYVIVVFKKQINSQRPKLSFYSYIVA